MKIDSRTVTFYESEDVKASAITDSTDENDLIVAKAVRDAHEQIIFLDIEATLPFITMHESIVSNHTVKEFEPNVIRESNQMIGTLSRLVMKDEKLVETITLIGEIKSGTTGMVGKLYYDSENMDIILVPDLVSVTLTTTSNRLSCYRLGETGEFTGSTKSLSMSNSKTSGVLKYSKPNVIASTVVSGMFLPGIGDNSATKVERTYNDDINIVESRSSTIRQFANLGSTTAVFGAGNSVPMFNVTQGSVASYDLRFIGGKAVDNIFIPIFF